MRVAASCLLAGVIVSLAIVQPSGCSSTAPKQTVDQRSGLEHPNGWGIVLLQTEAANTGWDESDPLVPPIELDNFPQATGGHSGEDTKLSPLAGLIPLDFSADRRAAFHPHGEQVCASGCAASNHPTPELSREQFERLMAQFALESMDETSRALETLLFYGRQTAALLKTAGTAPLDRRRAKFLRGELQRTHVLVSFRIVDTEGVIRAEIPPTRVPFDRRHVFDMESDGLPPLVSSGTVKRVGLYHLWTRL